MKILVAFAFLAILASLAMALVYMMRGGTKDAANPQHPQGHMAKALAFRVGFSILLFICVLIAWKLGWIQPSGIPAGA
jgi:formate/nitrite transporter FocA (FNT family)